MARERRVFRHRTRVAVLGAGNWGTTFAKILADGGADVMLWARRSELAAEIQHEHRNSAYLPGVDLPHSLRATSRLDLALAGAEHVFVSVPSQALRENLVAAQPHLGSRATVVSLMKGVEKSTGLRMSEVISEVLRLPPSRSRSSRARTSRSRSPRSSRPPRSSRRRASRPRRRSRASRPTRTSARS
ncbi:hypothetical protein GCM10025877_01860 [Agromyces mangrovi Wang et al. 2018]|nr:hypothetical protein GCM10025877_01860 [Agromyces mangrovi]